MKLPIRPLGLVVAGLLLGTTLAPVAAQQQQSGVDGQVAVRSDGAVYLISSGQRRWVATVVISDDEINAYPEGEPIFAGLALAGSAQASNNNPAPKPTSASTGSGSSGSGASGASATPAAAATAKPAATTVAAAPTSTPDPSLSSDLPVEVDVDGSTKMEQGEERRVDIKTKKEATCELTIRLSNGKEFSEDSKNADNQGKCRFNIQLPDDAETGQGVLIGTVREGGKVNKAELGFEVVKKK